WQWVTGIPNCGLPELDIDLWQGVDSRYLRRMIFLSGSMVLCMVFIVADNLVEGRLPVQALLLGFLGCLGPLGVGLYWVFWRRSTF
ncbi:MAG: hypothetical protein KKI08_22520, partial [Armatimonadetes bacterium]|nr:hypothetical protein [Armatimonadota bacterium]